MLRILLPATILILLLPVAAAAGEVPAWQPGGYEARIGRPYYYSVPAATVVTGYHSGDHHHGAGSHGCACNAAGRWHGGHFSSHHHAGWGWSHHGWVAGGDPYTYHFGPGFYRRSEHGHYRFPYYSYRRPWYHPGAPVFNRDTNFAW